MLRSTKEFISSLKNKIKFLKEFDFELFAFFLERDLDVFSDLSEIWLWFPADSEALGWHPLTGSEYIVDREELKAYVLFLRQVEDIYMDWPELIDFLLKLNKKCQQVIINLKKRVTIQNGLKTLLSKKLKF